MKNSMNQFRLSFLIVLIVLTSISLFTFSLLGLHQQAQAAFLGIHTVTKTTDTNDGVCNADCSLREAISQASDGDSIVFANDLALGGPVTLTLSLGELTISNSLSISGPEAGNLTISGNQNGRIFHISDGNSNINQQVTLSNLILINGKVGVGSYGGAIRATENITLHQMILRANQAQYGGGLFVSLGSNGLVNIEQSLIASNIATQTISTTPASAWGGGIYIDDQFGGAVSISDSQVSQNIVSVTTISGTGLVTGYGGGLFANSHSNGTSGFVNIVNTTFNGNQVLISSTGSVMAHGGALYLNNRGDSDGHGNTVLIQGSSILENLVTVSSHDLVFGKGGALYFDAKGDDNQAGGDISILNSHIDNNRLFSQSINSTILNGGAIFVDSQSSSSGAGKGGDFNLIHSSISNNVLSGTSTASLPFLYGGGLSIDNQSQEAASGGHVTITNSILSGNMITLTAVASTYSANGGGGAIYAQSRGHIEDGNGGHISILNSYINNNEVTAFSEDYIFLEGGAIKIEARGGSGESFGTANGGKGGYIFISNSDISNNTLNRTNSNNSGSVAGGGLYIDIQGGSGSSFGSGNGGPGGDFTIAQSTVSNNQIVSEATSNTPVNQGGGIYLRGDGGSDSSFGSGNGGPGGDVSIRNSTVSQNSITSSTSNSIDFGGGINIFNPDSDTAVGSNLEILHGTIVQNSIENIGSRNNLQNDATSIGGSTTQEGAGVYLFGRTALVTNTIIASNDLSPAANQDITGTINIWNSIIGIDSGVMITDSGGNITGTTSNPIDPQLGVLQNNGGYGPTHALLDGSQALESGLASSCLTVDQRGYGRPYDSDDNGIANCDIGAFENRIFNAYLPKVLNSYANLPDLVVQTITVTSDSVTLTIVNQGAAATDQDFWVDLYINPDIPPSDSNQTWETQGGQGIAWAVTSLSLAPNEIKTLSLHDNYYDPMNSNFSGTFPTNAQIYAQVDSVNLETAYGNILETHEVLNEPYNNIYGPVSP